MQHFHGLEHGYQKNFLRKEKRDEKSELKGFGFFLYHDRNYSFADIDCQDKHLLSDHIHRPMDDHNVRNPNWSLAGLHRSFLLRT